MRVSDPATENGGGAAENAEQQQQQQHAENGIGVSSPSRKPPPLDFGGDSVAASPARRKDMLPFELEKHAPKLRTAPFTPMTFLTWCRLLYSFRREIRWCRHFWPIFATTFITIFTTIGWLIEEIFVWFWPTVVRGKVRKIESPIFILGHYRSGTTLLHNMLCLDEERVQFCNNRQCIFPNTFRLIRSLQCVIKPLLPKHRPMDNVMLKFDMPQEDEYAAMLLSGGVSPFMQFFFLQHTQQMRLSKFMNFEEEDLYHANPVGPTPKPSHLEDPKVQQLRPSSKQLQKARSRWQANWLKFLSRVCYDNGGDDRRLLLKSPAHTGRVKLLLELFPDAKFIFVHRDPFDVWKSTVNMIDKVNRIFRLTQIPTNEEVSSFILSQYSSMHRAYFRDRHLIPEGNLVELSYQEVMNDPISQVEKVYSDLALGSLPREKMEAYIESEHNGFQGNKHRSLPNSVLSRINLEWGDVMEELGYGDLLNNGSEAV